MVKRTAKGSIMRFRENLLHLRAVNNMTQEQLAMLLGVSRQSVTKWESGKSSPEMDKLLKMCQIFDCTLDELVQGDLTDREAARTLARCASTEPEDLFGYDEEMRAFAGKVSNGVFAIIMGLAISMVFFSFADQRSAQLAENLLCALGLLCLFAGIGIGLALLIPGGMSHSAFVKAHPYIEDFYTQEQKAQARASFARQLIGGICCIFAGICAICAVADTPYEATLGTPLLLALIAIGARFIIHGSMMLGRTNLDSYNETAVEFMEASDIERADVSPEHKQKLLAAHKAEKRIGGICGAIMIIATIAGLTMLFVPEYQNEYFWLAWVFGGLLCGICAILMKGFSGDAE